jgi:hypothetical protein
MSISRVRSNVLALWIVTFVVFVMKAIAVAIEHFFPHTGSGAL